MPVEQNHKLLCKPLTHSHTMTPFDAPQENKLFENTVGKGEIARNEQFLLFPQCFLPVWIAFCRASDIFKIGAPGRPMEQNMVSHFLK